MAGGTSAGRQRPYRADIVVPCFNEEAMLPISVPQICAYLHGIVADAGNRLSGFRVLLVDDGSSDGTWPMIERFALSCPEVEGLSLSRNFGHQAAMLAGLEASSAEVIITMDADLQDDISAIAAMIIAYERGMDLVLGVRIERKTDSVVKRGTARAYYRLLQLMGANLIPDHADFRLMSRSALTALLRHNEVNLFLRGLIFSIGFPITTVPYERKTRAAGETKYTWRKMLRLAVDGITSFSIMPLRLIAVLGLVIFAGSGALGVLLLWLWFRNTDYIVPGWASTVLPILFLGGVQLLSIGVVGEYTGKIYLETKRRPRYLVRETTKLEAD